MARPPLNPKLISIQSDSDWIDIQLGMFIYTILLYVWGQAMGKARGKAGGEAGATPPSLNLPHRKDFPSNHYPKSRVKHPESMSTQWLELDIGVFQ